MRPHDDIRARRRKDRESGQAMVEFALILLPLLLLVAGIIQFGIGLNYWLDTASITLSEMRNRRHNEQTHRQPAAVDRGRETDAHGSTRPFR